MLVDEEMGRKDGMKILSGGPMMELMMVVEWKLIPIDRKTMNWRMEGPLL